MENLPGEGAGQVPAASGAGNPSDPAAGGGNPPAKGKDEPGTGGGNQEGEPKVYSAEYVAELRREAAKHRVAAQEAAAKNKQYEEAQLTEQEKRDKAFKEMQEENSRLRFESKKSTALVEAAKLGAVVPEAVVGLIPADADNIGQAVAAIKKQFPALFKAATSPPSGTADAGGGNTGGTAPPRRSMNDFLRVASGRQIG